MSYNKTRTWSNNHTSDYEFGCRDTYISNLDNANTVYIAEYTNKIGEYNRGDGKIQKHSYFNSLDFGASETFKEVIQQSTNVYSAHFYMRLVFGTPNCQVKRVIRPWNYFSPTSGSTWNKAVGGSSSDSRPRVRSGNPTTCVRTPPT